MWWPWQRQQVPTRTASSTASEISREELIAALRPFAFLCEAYVTDEMKDSTGIIFPGSKAAVLVGDLRRARSFTEAEGEKG